MKEQGNENISQKIVPKDEQGLEIPECQKGDSAVLGYSDYPMNDGVTYRVWSASNDDMSPQERLQNLMVRSAESGEEVKRRKGYFVRLSRLCPKDADQSPTRSLSREKMS